MKEKICLMLSFVLGVAVGYSAAACTELPVKAGGKREMIPVVLMPKDARKKAKKLKKDLGDIWEDISS